MRDADRYKLHGTYKTPRYRIGGRVQCQCRGEVQIVGTTAGRIPWPVAKPVGGTGNRALVIYGDLARAIRHESVQAVAHWWGVSPQTVTKWRGLLGLTGNQTDGTTRLRASHFREPWADTMRKLARAKARDPRRRAKISAAKLGQRRAPETVAKMRAARLGKKATTETRRKMRAAHKGHRPPWLNPAWTAAEDALLTAFPAAEVARQTGRTLQAVYMRRSVLRLPDGRRK